MDALKKQMYANRLLHYYDSLLTDHQRRIMHYYFFDDYSLSEIAEIIEVSRNAIHDTIQKAIKKLEDYESKLNLIEKHEHRLTIIKKASEITSNDVIITLLEDLKKVE